MTIEAQYQLVKHEDPSNFLSQVSSLLLKNESRNNLVLGLAGAAARNSDPRITEAHFWELTKNEMPEGCGIKTSPDRGLLVSVMPEESAREFAKRLVDADFRFPEMVGPRDVVEAMVEEFEKLRGDRFRVAMEQGIYEAKHIIAPSGVEGALSSCHHDEFATAYEFILGFLRDCFPGEAKSKQSEEAKKLAELRVENKSLYFWRLANGKAVAMGAEARESPHGSTISYIYTPSSERGKGYGAAVTAAISQLMLDRGKSLCNLFTNLANPTSNSIYQKVGYRRIGDSLHVKLRG